MSPAECSQLPAAPAYFQVQIGSKPIMPREDVGARIAPQPAPTIVTKTAAELHREALLAKIDAARIRSTDVTEEPEPRLFLAGKPISTPGNLTTFVAKAKAGKSAAIGGAIAAAIAAASGTRDVDALGFTASDPSKRALIVIDTEQCRHDARLCLMRSLNRAEAEVEPSWLLTYSLVGESPAEICEMLPIVMETASRDHAGIFAVVIDGVADLVTDVNSIEESVAVRTMLQRLAIEHDCPILNVIHANEGRNSGDDPRGWIGKELIRKSESNLILVKVNGVTTITSDRQRGAPITKEDGVAFCWDDALKRQVSCGSPAIAKQQAKNDALRDLARSCFTNVRTLSYGGLKEAIRIQKGSCGISTAERIVKEMTTKVIINRDAATGTYALALP